ncbi:IMPACT family member YigZ [Pseudoscardovia radai]|uniref:IMPACT family member YigZ n=1 Tax=Pseudoscardovia radai TaxID=987066 RepID=A0A261F089_9BIFI|nr:YigZ family protein [Pseudoscardovia radai]OZG52529.1 IMPACT family member YigZ [Pseudoscardovia radai]
MTTNTALATILDDAGSPARGTYEDRKSEFIGEICHIEDPDSAIAFAQRVREANPKARHVAYAAVWGVDVGSMGERMSDDGEPSGTAGKPILEAIRSRGLTDCVVTVTRYFGGILLGSGGLIRAYSNAAGEAIAAAHRATIARGVRFQMRVGYSRHDQVLQLVRACGGTVAHEDFAADVTVSVDIPEDAADSFVVRLRDATAGAVIAQKLGDVRTVVPVEDAG